VYRVCVVSCVAIEYISQFSWNIVWWFGHWKPLFWRVFISTLHCCYYCSNVKIL